MAADLQFSVGLVKTTLEKDIKEIREELEKVKNIPLSVKVVLDKGDFDRQLQALSGHSLSINVDVGNLDKVVSQINNLTNIVGKGSNPIPIDKLFGFNDIDQRLNKFVTEMQTKLSQATSAHAFKVATGNIENLSIDINKIAEDARKALMIVPSGNFEEVRVQIEKIAQAFAPLNQGSTLFEASSKNMQQKLTEIQGSISAIQSVTNDPNTFNGFQKQCLEMFGMLGQVAEAVRGNVESVARAIKDMKLDHFGESIKKVSDNLAELTSNVEKFGTAMANDKGMRDFIQGLGAMISMVRNNVEALRTKGVGGIDMNEGVKDMTKNYEKLADAIIRLDHAKQQAESSVKIAQSVGLSDADTEKTLKYIQVLDMVRDKLVNLHGDGTKMVGKDVFTSAFYSVEEVEKIMKVLKGTDATLAKDSTAIAQLFNALVKEVNNYTKSLQEAKLGTDQINKTIEKLENTKSSIQGSIASGLLNGQDVNALNQEVTRIDEILSKLRSNTMSTEGKLGILTNASVEINGFYQSASNASQAVKQIEKENTELAKSVTLATNKYNELEGVLMRLNTTRINGANAGVDVSNLDQAIQKVESFQRRFQEAMNNGGKDSLGKTAKEIDEAYKSVKKSADNAAYAVKEETKELTRNGSVKSSTASSTRKLTEEEERLKKAIQDATNSGREQSQVLSDLRSMAMQYASVWGMYGFAKEVAQVTGELELQKRSLEVILDSVGKAGELYGQIQALSQQSPYDFQSLLKSTRQLAAFGIETKDLFGTMKALSDIGAGLSVDVNRLILAFGHTRSYGYLSGIQNRQFENAGIDLMGELMKKYNAQADADRAAGRNSSYVTRKDLFGRMRSKDIPFEDVQDVILGLDKPGGRFYNMQERQFDTLGGKLRNLNNNYNIMLSEIGQSQKGLLMGTVDAINSMTENWNKWYIVIKDIVVALGAAKVAMIALNQSTTASKVFNNAMSQGIARANQNDILRGGWGLGNNQYVLGRAYANSIIEDKNLTKVQKAQAAMHENVSANARKKILRDLGYTNAEIKKINAQIASGHAWTLRWGLAFRSMASQISMAFKALALNPMTWIFAAVGAITHIVGRIKEADELREKLSEDMKRQGMEDSQNVDDFFAENSSFVSRKLSKEYQVSGVGVTVKNMELTFDENSIRLRGARDLLAEVTKELQQYDPLYHGHIIDIMALEDDVEKVKKAFEYLNSVELTQRVMSLDDSMASTLAEGPAWYNLGFTDTIIEDLKDYKSAMNDLKESFKEQIDTEEKYIRKDAALRSQIEKRQKITGESRLDAMFNDFAYGRMRNSNSRVPAAVKDAEKDAKAIAEQFKATFEAYFKDDDDAAVIYFQTQMSKMFSEAKISDDTQKNVFTNMVIDALSNIDSNTIRDKVQKINLLSHIAEEARGVIKATSTEDELVSLFDQLAKKTMEWGESMGYDLKAMGMDHAEAYREGFTAVVNEVQFTDEWQKRASTQIVNSSLRNQIKGSSKAQFFDLVKKDYKEKKEFIEAQVNTLPKIKAFIGMDLGLKFNMDLKSITAIKNRLENLIKAPTNVETKDRLNSILKNEILPLYDALSAIGEYETYSSSEGFSLNDKKKKGSGTKKDEILEAFKKRYQYMQRAYSDYKQWRDKIGGGAALSEVQKSYKDLLSPEDLKSIDDYRGSLEKLYKAVRDAKKGNTEPYKDLASQIRELIDTKVGIDEFTESAKNMASVLSKAIADLTRVWDMYTKIADTTGDRGIAARFANYGGNFINASNKADAVKALMNSRFANVLGYRDIKFNSNLSEDGVKNMVMGAMGGRADKTYIDAVIASYKEWQKLQQEVERSSITSYAELISKTETYAQKVKKIDEEYQKTIDNLGVKDSNGKYILTEEERRKGAELAGAKKELSMKELEPETIRFFKSIESLSKTSANAIAQELIKAYKKAFASGIMNAEEFKAKMQEVMSILKGRNGHNESILDKLKNFFFSREDSDAMEQILGLIEENSEIIQRLRNSGGNQTEIDRRVRTNTALGNVYLGAGGSKERKIAYNGMFLLDNESNVSKWKEIIADGISSSQQKSDAKRNLKAYEKALSKFEKYTKNDDGTGKTAENLEELRKKSKQAADVFGQIVGLGSKVQGLLKAMGKSSDEFDNGLEFFQSGASIIQGVASGNYIQAAGGLIDMATWAWGQNDRMKKREIELRQKEISALEDNTNAIRQMREHILGYDDGELARKYRLDQAISYDERSSYMRMMRLNEFAGTSAARGGRDYDKNQQANSSSSKANGYEIELSNLKTQLKDYQVILQEQEGMKDKSSADINATKNKIAELQEKVAFYTEDIAKELWSLDIKGWAGQISDALCNAFENGENAAKAYKDTVRSIMQQVMNSMLKIGVLEPMFEGLREKLFGEDGKGGLFSISDPQGSIGNVTKYLASYFGEGGEGKKSIDAALSFIEGFEDVMKQFGLSVKNESQNALSSAIQGTSEETSNLLAAYVNALRQDVSIIRLMQESFYGSGTSFEDYFTKLTGDGSHLANIDTNIAAIKTLFDEQGILHSKISQMSDDIHDVIYGSQSFKMK